MTRLRLAAFAAAAMGGAVAVCAPCPGRAESDPRAASPFHVIAHRGASAEAPENTPPAFERARALGAEEVELDVQLSRDGEVVLFHDDDLAEKTDLAGRVRDHDAEALRRADIGSWYDATHPEAPRRYAGTGLATLAEVFDRFEDAFHYHVEIKSAEPELPDRVLALAVARNLASHLTVTSFQVEQLLRVRRAAPHVRTAWLLEDPGRGVAAIDRAAREGFHMVAFRAAELTRELVERAHARGLEIRAWKVRSGEEMERVIRLGANGMTIDWPDRLLRRLEELRSGG